MDVPVAGTYPRLADFLHALFEAGPPGVTSAVGASRRVIQADVWLPL